MPKKKVNEAVEETAQETIPVEKAPAQMPRRQGSEDLLELNDLERGVTREDIFLLSIADNLYEPVVGYQPSS